MAKITKPVREAMDRGETLFWRYDQAKRKMQLRYFTKRTNKLGFYISVKVWDTALLRLAIEMAEGLEKLYSGDVLWFDREIERMYYWAVR